MINYTPTTKIKKEGDYILFTLKQKTHNSHEINNLKHKLSTKKAIEDVYFINCHSTTWENTLLFL